MRLGKGNFPLARAGVGRIPVFVPLPKSVLRGVRAGGAEEIILKAAMGNTAEDAENPEDAGEAGIAFCVGRRVWLTHWGSRSRFAASAFSASSASSAVSIAGSRITLKTGLGDRETRE